VVRSRSGVAAGSWPASPCPGRAAGFDGDTPRDERDWVRNHARWVFTNPDMLHRGILPRHGRWALFLRRLRYVVLDECHSYRGLFGSHVARYGTNPTFVLASATVAEPARPATALTGLPVVAVTEDGSPQGEQTVALWEPPLQAELAGEHGAPVRRSAGAEAARIMADLVLEGARTLTFVRSRRGAELTALATRRVLSQVDPALADRVAAYRAGFLPEERRALESALSCGELLGVATTNALGLGVDIAGLDAVVVAGYPGTRASFSQQAGRADRKSRDALVMLVAGDDPLDSYLVRHPEALLGAPVEQCVLDPANPYVLAPQLACAAAELPITPADVDGLFGPAAVGVLESLVAQGQLRRRAAGWFCASPSGRPSSDVDIRGSGGDQVAVVEGDSGRMLGTVDLGTAPGTVHPGAVYLHQGSSFVVDELDFDAGLALVHAEDPEWNTWARSVVDIVISSTLQRRGYGPVDVALGEVEVTEKVVGYLRRLPSGEVLDQVTLDMPVRTLRTRAVWYTVTDGLLAAAGLDPARIPGSLHAAGHAAIELQPLFATCDRRDIGGVSAALHRDTGRATVFVHDGHQGGAGFADRGYAALEPWLAATRDASPAAAARAVARLACSPRTAATEMSRWTNPGRSRC
jgi:DEAD/DEAH box helicase domain-containing protein